MADERKLTAEELNQLGLDYYWGNGAEVDLHRSAYYLEKAAKAGCLEAMYNTGQNYSIGCGVPVDIEKCLYWLNKAANNGYQPAMESLGHMYYSGDGVTKDYRKALDYFERGIACGNPYAMLMAARQYERGEGTKTDKEKAMKLYTQAYDFLYEMAIEDDYKAQLWMGFWYFDGCELIGVHPDYAQAVSWFRKAATVDFPEAQYYLGLCYEFGLGIVQDNEEAVRLYKLAAQKQNPDPLCNLALMFYYGQGVKQDDKKAAEYFCQAANLGNGAAQSNLGYCYLKGKGVEKDELKAVFWFRKASENGQGKGFENLAECYMKGLGVTKDEQEGFRIYCKGAELNSLCSRVSIAECYIEGWGTEKDFTKAANILEAICYELQDYEQKSLMAVVEWDRVFNPFDKEYLKNYAKAFYLLATLKYAGNGTARDPNGAILLLRLADRFGYKNEELPEKTAQAFMDKILSETERCQVEDTVRSQIEVRDLGNWKKGQMCRYAITIHHADGTHSDIRFKTQRNKFVYLLSLLFAYNSQSAGVMARFFALGRDMLARLAKEAEFDVKDQGMWIDEYIYKEVYVAEAKRYQYEYSNTRYSIAVSQSNDYLDEACTSREEYETFCLRTSGGRESIASIAVNAEQVILPPSLVTLSEQLPSKNELLSYRKPMVRPIDYREYLLLQRGEKNCVALE